ncbi:hypothetical protein BCR34DRAFT_649961, partial [Clohesyomyces aquaticus]
EDKELAVIKAGAYRGIAKIQLSALNFEHPLVQQEHRKVSIQNVRRLQRVFERNGCWRLQEENFVNAIVDDVTLNASLAAAGLGKDDFLQVRHGQPVPWLNLHNIDCLSGLHRIEAAKGFLDDNDQ